MKTILKELASPFAGLTLKQKAIIVYFAISLCTLCVGDDTPVWALILLIANFDNAARLVRKVPLPEND
jgi:hypothetical protein